MPAPNEVVLNWQPVFGAVSYNIYRGQTSGSEVLLATGVTGADYTDSALVGTYGNYYEVTAVNANLAPVPGESDFSAEVVALPGIGGPAAPNAGDDVSYDLVGLPLTTPDGAPLYYSFALSPFLLAGKYASASPVNSYAYGVVDEGTFTVYAQAYGLAGWNSPVFSLQVIVHAVAPIATFSNNGPVPLGSPAMVSFSDPFDLSPKETAIGFHYSMSLTNSGLNGDWYSSSPSPIAAFTLPDWGTYTVFGRIFEQSGPYTQYTTAVTVTDVPPTASVSVSSGNNVTYSPVEVKCIASSLSPSDSKAGLHYSFATDPAQLATFYASAAPSSTDSFTFDIAGTQSIYARVFTVDNEYIDCTTSVVVQPAPPTAVLSNTGPVSEGDAAQVSFSNAADPSLADTAAGFLYSFATDPSQLATSYAAANSSPSASFTFLDAGNYTIHGRIFNIENAYQDFTTMLTVTDVPPTAELSNNGPGFTTDPVTVAFTNPSDISPAATTAGFTYSFALAPSQLAKSYAVASSQPSTSFSFDALGTYTVYGRIFDVNNGYTDYTTVVVVSFTPPTATLTNSGPVDEGVPVTIDFSNQADTNEEDVDAGFHYSFATTPSGLAISYATAGTAACEDFTLLDAGDIPIYGRILGFDGGYSDYTTAVTVNDVPPTATLNNSGPGYVSDPVAIKFSNAYDISPAATAAGFHYSFATDPTQLAATYAAAGASPTEGIAFWRWESIRFMGGSSI